MCCPGFLCDLLTSSAVAFRRPWTPRTRWMSFWGEPSTPGASTSWEKTTLRSSCSPSRHPAWRKRFRQRPATIRWASDSNLIDYMEAGSSCWPSSSALSPVSVFQEGGWSFWRLCCLHSPGVLLHIIHTDCYLPTVSTRHTAPHLNHSGWFARVFYCTFDTWVDFKTSQE